MIASTCNSLTHAINQRLVNVSKQWLFFEALSHKYRKVIENKRSRLLFYYGTPGREAFRRRIKYISVSRIKFFTRRERDLLTCFLGSRRRNEPPDTIIRELPTVY